ncbi:hypothetical protein HETIRDRAFT_310795 [Heterobasidion irregulare TC 32-1]|uniref:Uncharacterized protein n=1 Tax=Heterobasidion irregulare (strain TC 32-1) TaxID=747525 RepID=W4KIQ5_HETIT|nr:uncharacterized protein HETIRDRAFT_310795 [Heterobasidion irregulare TC 32-1]ETW85200.1 hypothetical protein HETIRDRAFT_310795 [Heterobasidion irregulare TC 32-1]
MTAQKCYDKYSWDQSQYSVLANVLWESVSLYCLSSQLLHGQANAILYHCLAILVICYFFFIFIGSPIPVPVTYAWVMDPEHLGFCHR